MELSNWRGWRDTTYLSFTATIGFFDFRVLTGEDAWLTGVFTRASDDAILIRANGLEIYRQSGTANEFVQFKRPIPVMIRDQSSVWAVQVSYALGTAGSASIQYVRQET